MNILLIKIFRNEVKNKACTHFMDVEDLLRETAYVCLGSPRSRYQDKIKLDRSVLEEIAMGQKGKGTQEGTSTHEPDLSPSEKEKNGKIKGERKEERG